MYNIVEPQPEFKYKFTTALGEEVEQVIKPIVSILNDSEGRYYNIITNNDIYEIFENHSSVGGEDWHLKVCSFDKYFLEVLRLLPENPADLYMLNQDYYKEMLKLWQSEENYSLDKTILEFEDLTRRIEEQIGEKKEGI